MKPWNTKHAFGYSSDEEDEMTDEKMNAPPDPGKPPDPPDPQHGTDMPSLENREEKARETQDFLVGQIGRQIVAPTTLQESVERFPDTPQIWGNVCLPELRKPPDLSLAKSVNGPPWFQETEAKAAETKDLQSVLATQVDSVEMFPETPEKWDRPCGFYQERVQALDALLAEDVSPGEYESIGRHNMELPIWTDAELQAQLGDLQPNELSKEVDLNFFNIDTSQPFEEESMSLLANARQRHDHLVRQDERAQVHHEMQARFPPATTVTAVGFQTGTPNILRNTQDTVLNLGQVDQFGYFSPEDDEKLKTALNMTQEEMEVDSELPATQLPILPFAVSSRPVLIPPLQPLGNESLKKRNKKEQKRPSQAKKEKQTAAAAATSAPATPQTATQPPMVSITAPGPSQVQSRGPGVEMEQETYTREGQVYSSSQSMFPQFKQRKETQEDVPRHGRLFESFCHDYHSGKLSIEALRYLWAKHMTQPHLFEDLHKDNPSNKLTFEYMLEQHSLTQGRAEITSKLVKLNESSGCIVTNSMTSKSGGTWYESMTTSVVVRDIFKMVDKCYTKKPTFNLILMSSELDGMPQDQSYLFVTALEIVPEGIVLPLLTRLHDRTRKRRSGCRFLADLLKKIGNLGKSINAVKCDDDLKTAIFQSRIPDLKDLRNEARKFPFDWTMKVSWELVRHLQRESFKTLENLYGAAFLESLERKITWNQEQNVKWPSELTFQEYGYDIKDQEWLHDFFECLKWITCYPLVSLATSRHHQGIGEIWSLLLIIIKGVAIPLQQRSKLDLTDIHERLVYKIRITFCDKTLLNKAKELGMYLQACPIGMDNRRGRRLLNNATGMLERRKDLAGLHTGYNANFMSGGASVSKIKLVIHKDIDVNSNVDDSMVFVNNAVVRIGAKFGNVYHGECVQVEEKTIVSHSGIPDINVGLVWSFHQLASQSLPLDTVQFHANEVMGKIVQGPANQLNVVPVYLLT